MAEGNASTDSLYEQAEEFARELSETLVGSLPSSPEAVAEVADAAERVIVRPERDVPLLIDGERFGDLRVRIRCQLDSRGTWLAVESSSFQLVAAVDRAPIIRFDYLRQPKSVPAAHVQVHAHRGALTHLLSQAGHRKPHDMAALHIPVGGARLRPCLEDVIQFLVADCGFDAVDGWQEVLNAGRARWRRTQAKAITRDFPAEAGEVLESMGYLVTAPEAGHPDSSEKALYSW